MSSIESAVAALAGRVKEHSETIQTEEAVKTSVILPFLQALGYDIFNPAEVVPEFTAGLCCAKSVTSGVPLSPDAIIPQAL